MPDERDEKFFETARKRRDEAHTAWSDIYTEYTDDLKMVTGEQWNRAVVDARKNAGRPALTFNREHTNVQLITNAVRQNNPQVKIVPVSNGADEISAKVHNGIIRFWNYQSQGDVARDTAVKCAASGGIGYYKKTKRYCTEFLGPDEIPPDDGSMWNQDLATEPIQDPTTVHFDPFVRKFDFSDARYCFEEMRMPWDLYRDEFGEEASTLDWETLRDAGAEQWGTEEYIVLAVYWWVEAKKKRLVRLNDDREGFYEDLFPNKSKPAKGVIVKDRMVTVRTIHADLINGVEKLKSTTWEGTWIPIIPVLGEETYVDGKRILASLVRYVHDGQRLLNGYKSGIAEAIGLANRVPYTGPKGMFDDQKWQTANINNYAFLEWTPVYDRNGQMIQASPVRTPFEPAIQALSIASGQAADDMKAGMGIFDSSTGAAPQEYSGISVEKRTRQADLTNFHFQDNLARAMWHEGRIDLEMVAKLIDAPRAMQIMDQDGTISEKLITQALSDDVAGNAYSDKPYSTAPDGPRRIPGREHEEHHHIDVGKYSLRVITGPGYTTKRQEEFETWAQLAQTVPQLWAAAGDIIVRNSDAEGKDQIADSLLAIMPPAIQALRKGNQPLPPEVEAQMAQGQQVIQGLQAENQQLKFEKAAKVVDNQGKLEISRQDNAAKHLNDMETNAVRVLVAEITADTTKTVNELNGRLAAAEHMLNLLHETELAADPATGPLGMHPDKPLPPPEVGAAAAGGPTQ